MNPTEPETDFAAIVFPHCTMRVTGLKKALALFGPITICRPWFLASDLLGGEQAPESLIRIHYPPADLKPEAEFERLLTEYRRWIRQNRDSSYACFLKATEASALSENTPWEIRRMIRGGENGSSAQPGANVLKWHLILHLAAELEESLGYAEEIMHRLKEAPSPLRDALEEPTVTGGLLDDLSLPESTPLIEENKLKMVAEAWMGLFGNALDAHRLLLTRDSTVFHLLVEKAKQDSFETGALPKPSAAQFRLPDVSTLSLEEIVSFRNQYLDDRVRATLGKLITGLESRERPPDEIPQLIRKLEEAFPMETAASRIRVILQRLSAQADSGDKEGALAGRIAGKTIVLLEDM